MQLDVPYPRTDILLVPRYTRVEEESSPSPSCEAKKPFVKPSDQDRNTAWDPFEVVERNMFKSGLSTGS